MKISKINRYDGQYIDGSVGRPLALCENGDYVLYAVARAREDALLGALKLTVKHMETLHCEDAYGGCCCSLERCDCVLAGDYSAVTDCIRDIEATR